MSEQEELDNLIDAVVAAAGDITCVYEWATGGEWAQKRLDETKAALKAEFIRLTAELKRLRELILNWSNSDNPDSFAVEKLAEEAYFIDRYPAGESFRKKKDEANYGIRT